MKNVTYHQEQNFDRLHGVVCSLVIGLKDDWTGIEKADFVNKTVTGEGKADVSAAAFK